MIEDLRLFGGGASSASQTSVKPGRRCRSTPGFVALADQRTGKRTLRTHVVQTMATPKMSAKELLALRERMNLSRALFAKYLRTNVRTLENWEQGRARPNAQAALLIRMVERFPDTVERLAKI